MDSTGPLQRIADAVQVCVSAFDGGQADQATCRSVIEALEGYMQVCCRCLRSSYSLLGMSASLGPAAVLLQHGLKGNRAVEPTSWSVVSAMTRAYPLLLGPCMTHAVSQGLGQDSSLLLQYWLLQARAPLTPLYICCMFVASTLAYCNHRQAETTAW